MPVKVYKCQKNHHFLENRAIKCPHRDCNAQAAPESQMFQDAITWSGLGIDGNPDPMAVRKWPGAQSGTGNPIKLVELKRDYQASNTISSEPRLFKTIDPRRDLQTAGIDPSQKRELDFTNLPDDPRTTRYPGYDSSPNWKGFRVGAKRYYRFVFAFPTALDSIYVVSKQMAVLGWLPEPTKKTYMYVFEVPPFIPYCCKNGTYFERGTLQVNTEVMFPEMIEAGWITHAYEVDHKGKTVLIYNRR